MPSNNDDDLASLIAQIDWNTVTPPNRITLNHNSFRPQLLGDFLEGGPDAPVGVALNSGERGDYINIDFAQGGTVTGETWRQRTPEEILSDIRSAFDHMAPTPPITVEQDRQNTELIGRFSSGDITAEEERLMNQHHPLNVQCGCDICARSLYTQVLDRYPAREFRSDDVSHRNLIASAITILLEGGSLPPRGQPRRYWGTAPAPEAARLAQQRFARQRADRGHPLPNQQLAADWKPNAWEA